MAKSNQGLSLVCERAALLRAVGHLKSVVAGSTIPILANLRIEAARGVVTLTAGDTEIEVSEPVTAEITHDGVTTAPAHTLYDIVRKFPDGSQVEIATLGDGTRLAVRCGRSRFELGALPAEDYPLLGAGPLGTAFEVAASDLRTLIDRSRFAISTEEARYYLNGIFLHAGRAAELPVLRAVATDGHRLARIELPLPEGAAAMPGVIIPRKTVAEVRKLIDGTTAPIRISVSESKIRFAFDAITVISRLIDGIFPDYERVIPVGNDRVMEVKAKPFAAAVDRVATISTEKSRAVKLTLSRDTLTLSATSPETGSATEEIEVGYNGPILEVGFNSRYLLDVAQQIEGDQARFIFADAAAPAIVRDPANGGALYVLMPLRV